MSRGSLSRRCGLLMLVTAGLVATARPAWAEDDWHPPLLWKESVEGELPAVEGYIPPVTSDQERANLLERLAAYQARLKASESTPPAPRRKGSGAEKGKPGKASVLPVTRASAPVPLMAASALPVSRPQAPVRLWIGEARRDLVRRIGAANSHQGALVETRGGLVTWFDAPRGKLVRYRNEDPRFASSQGVRPGMDLETVLRLLVSADGVFVASEPTTLDPGTLVVQSMDDGLRVEMQLEDRRWLSRVVWGDTPTGTLRAGSNGAGDQPLRRLDARAITRILAGQPDLPARRPD
ncbi:MAG: hypothetical protein VKP72_02375 [bacterium]|nr:hypothetical protein [bacterium]